MYPIHPFSRISSNYYAYLHHTKRENYLINDADDLECLLIREPGQDVLLASLISFVLNKLTVPEESNGRKIFDT